MPYQDKKTSSSKVNHKFMLPENPKIPEGEYPAKVTGWKVIPVMFGSPKMVVQCDVVFQDTVIPLAFFCNVKLTEDNEIIPPGRRTNLYKLMTAMLPSDSRERSLNDLIGLQCWAKVGTSVNDDRGRPKPLSEQFSVIRQISPKGQEPDDVPF